MDLLDLGLIGVLVFCFVGAAVLAAAEVSIVRVRRSAVLLEVGPSAARPTQLLRLLDDLPVVLNAVLLVALGLQVSAATVAGVLAGRWFGSLGVTATTVLLTAALFVWSEAVPKTRAMRSPQATALRLTPLLRLVVVVFRPVVAVLAWLAGLQARGEQVSAVGALTEEEILALAQESAAVGAIGESDAQLVARSFDFNDRRVDEVMVIRDHIAATRHDVAASTALTRAVAAGHRRLPVHRGDLDDIIGIVRLRDLAVATASGSDPPVGALVVAVLRCGPGDLISTLLRRMQRSGRWVAIVTGASGRTLGLATVEDIVAELVGDIEDERAAVEPDNRGDGAR